MRVSQICRVFPKPPIQAHQLDTFFWLVFHLKPRETPSNSRTDHFEKHPSFPKGRLGFLKRSPFAFSSWPGKVTADIQMVLHPFGSVFFLSTGPKPPPFRCPFAATIIYRVPSKGTPMSASSRSRRIYLFSLCVEAEAGEFDRILVASGRQISPCPFFWGGILDPTKIRPTNRK